jgi:Putative zinc-binding metallo-peptidase
LSSQPKVRRWKTSGLARQWGAKAKQLSSGARRDTIEAPNCPYVWNTMPRRKLAWTELPDEQLLELRLKDLNLTLDGTWLEDCLGKLYEELAERGIQARPHAWISNEWFSPENTPGIAIPFYLTHPRLMHLERKMIIDVEGGTWSECMSILRHEAGHVLQHSYQLQRRRQWQRLFGRSSQRYPRYYRPNPASRHFVQHLRFWYAQSHPDEDFAETFAVWLRPRSNWRSRYDGWPALKKLEYVDELMGEIAGQRPLLTTRERVDPLSQLSETLREHYRKKQALYVFDTPTTYDRDLLRLFSADPKHGKSQLASMFIRRNRARIRQLVAKWTGEYQLTLDAVLNDIVARCRELNLRAVGPEHKLVLEFSVLLTAKTMHALFGPSRRKWIAL